MTMKKKIQIIKNVDCVYIDRNKIEVREVGQKAWGLCQMPEKWTLPFFVVSNELYLTLLNNKNNSEKFKIYVMRLLEKINEEGLGEKIIIRSSGYKEGMEERGKFESVACSVDKFGENLLDLIIKLSDNPEVSKEGIPLIVQKYIEADIVGHLSNERRVAKENRDFIYEYENNNMVSVDSGKIPLRNWRKKFDIKEYDEDILSETNLVETLKIVCAFYYYKGERVHIEFIYIKDTVYLVQCDYAVEKVMDENPEQYKIKVNYDREFQPEVLRHINNDDKGKYKKIDNLFTYREVGEKIPILYILDDKKTLSELVLGIVSDGLKRDLKQLLKGSLIIRTNVICDDVLEVQLSKRSNEVKTYDSAISFLKETSDEFFSNGINRYIFILHNFIPAKAAAFVNAQPLNEFVEIQALWGLPEGLYYNAHDTLIVDTRSINEANMCKDKFIITEKTVYKENYIAPDSAGDWVIKKLEDPYDWKCTISNHETIKDIAFRSRKIAAHLNEELSIMWFISIDESYYGVCNLPWYHEKYDRQSFYRNKGIAYKKKYFYEKEVIISNESDIENLKYLDSKEVGIVKIQPIDDRLLRSKSFIAQIGEACKEKNVSILLEGASLTHTFYQLKDTGARVLTTYDYKEPGEVIEYNKLVRDKIPEIIRTNGESINCRRIVEGGLVIELKKKLLEEAYEVFDAYDRSEIIEELADLEEVCKALECNEDIEELYDLRLVKKIGEPFFQFDLTALNGQKQTCFINNENMYISATMERAGCNLQILFIFNKVMDNTESIPFDVSKHKEKNEILREVLKIVHTSSTANETREAIKKIRQLGENIRKQYNCLSEEFEKIRVNKEEKKGGFQKGYILFDTSRKFSSSRQNNIADSLVDEKNIGEVNHIYVLKENERIDTDIINGDRLLIRLKIQVHGKKNQWTIRRDKVDDYFNKTVKVKIKKKIEGTNMIFGVEIIKENEEQIAFSFMRT